MMQELPSVASRPGRIYRLNLNERSRSVHWDLQGLVLNYEG